MQRPSRAEAIPFYCSIFLRITLPRLCPIPGGARPAPPPEPQSFCFCFVALCQLKLVAPELPLLRLMVTSSGDVDGIVFLAEVDDDFRCADPLEALVPEAAPILMMTSGKLESWPFSSRPVFPYRRVRLEVRTQPPCILG